MSGTTKDRLTAYLKYKGINKSEFGRMIGVSNAYISSIRKSIRPDKAERIAASFPDLNPSWLMTGEGDMLNHVEEKAADSGGEDTSAMGKLLREVAAIRRLLEQVVNDNPKT